MSAFNKCSTTWTCSHWSEILIKVNSPGNSWLPSCSTCSLSFTASSSSSSHSTFKTVFFISSRQARRVTVRRSRAAARLRDRHRLTQRSGHRKLTAGRSRTRLIKRYIDLLCVCDHVTSAAPSIGGDVIVQVSLFFLLYTWMLAGCSWWMINWLSVLYSQFWIHTHFNNSIFYFVEATFLKWTMRVVCCEW